MITNGFMSSIRYIVETGHRSNVSICTKTESMGHLYTSNGRDVKIHINTNDDTAPDFVLHYHGKISLLIIVNMLVINSHVFTTYF